MKSENTPSQNSIAPGEVIKLHTRFGSLSRGKCWGKCFPHKTAPVGSFDWVDKSDGTLYLTKPGYYIVGSNDGYNRSAKGEFHLAATEPVVDAVGIANANSTEGVR